MSMTPLTKDRNAADGMATAGYNKLQSRRAGAFPIAKVQSHIIVIDDDSVLTAVFIHRVTAALRPENNKGTPDSEPT